MDGWTVAWLLWLGLFGAIEGAALVRKAKGDTLSEHVWKWFSIRGRSTGWQGRRAILVMFLAWLVGHFLTGGAI